MKPLTLMDHKYLAIVVILGIIFWVFYRTLYSVKPFE